LELVGADGIEFELAEEVPAIGQDPDLASSG
jgi:hypothetical protein